MDRIKELISKMTLEEKASLCSGADNWHTKEIKRLNIPSVMMVDGPHGLRKQEGETDHLGLNESVKAVCFPAACATASSFDVDPVSYTHLDVYKRQGRQRVCSGIYRLF